MHRHYLDLIRYRSYVDLKSESAQSYLGMLWWILDPLFYLAMYYLVFGVILQRGGEGFRRFSALRAGVLALVRQQRAASLKLDPG